jgi:hypothetical protein
LGTLEPRCLLAGSQPTAVWLGQDGHDLVGGSSASSPADGVQDIDILLSNLPAGLTITTAQINGDGGDLWIYNNTVWNPWSAMVVPVAGTSQAHLYIDPDRVETGRNFFIGLTFNDGSTAQILCAGGTANPSVRMPANAVQATWLGQDGHDLTGPGPSVGPDGIQDVDLALAHLGPLSPVQSVTVTSSSGQSWAYGLNPGVANNAELVLNPTDPTRANLYFSPIGNMSGQTLTVTVAYNNGKTDLDTTSITAGTTNAALAMPAPALPSLNLQGLSASWVGQDGLNLVGPGDVHVSLTGLPTGASITSATLTDGSGVSWYQSTAGGTNPFDYNSYSLAIKPTAGTASADLCFPPFRDETGQTMTLLLNLSNGTSLATTFTGGSCNANLTAASPASTSVVAHPGDNLNALATQYGSIHLSAGTYNLSQPLVLTKPVSITADPGAVLNFSQQAGAAPWNSAISIGASNTTLNGFTVQFSAPVQWDWNTFFGPAVIGVVPQAGVSFNHPLVGITLTHLNVISAPAATSWEPAPNLMRLVYAETGTISNNTLKGGTITFVGGPWQIVNNVYQGTVAGTYSYGVFAMSSTHDVVITGNTITSAPGSGKTWRFLVMSQSGVDDQIENNTISGVGPMDSDTIPDPNAPEILLSESYNLHFEGTPAGLSSNGLVLQIPSPPGGAAQSGDVVAILSGSNAGQWVRIAQPLSVTTYLLSAPLPAGNYDISVTNGGFVNETYEANTFNLTGSSRSQAMVLPGNQFGAQIVNNTIIGGGVALSLSAYPTGYPNIWGWSHVPFLGATVSGNTFQDTLNGVLIDVDHSVAIKTNQGRVYLSMTLRDNTTIWTNAFLTANGGATPAVAYSVGDTGSSDAGELVLTQGGNVVQVPANIVSTAVMLVSSGTVNGKPAMAQSIGLPTVAPNAPSGLRLLNDTGQAPSDGITTDPTLVFTPDSSASGYEYSLSGLPATYLPVGSPAGFIPIGLSAGFNTVFVRGFNASGMRGNVVAITYVYDTSGGQASGSGGGNGSRTTLLDYRLGASGNYVPLGTSVAVPAALLNGTPVPVTVETVSNDSGSGLDQRTVGTGSGQGTNKPTPKSGHTGTPHAVSTVQPKTHPTPANAPAYGLPSPSHHTPAQPVKVLGHGWKRTNMPPRTTAPARRRLEAIERLLEIRATLSRARRRP